MDYNIAPIMILMTLFLVLGAVARQVIVNRRMRDLARLNAELQGKLLDRLTAAGELQSYIASDAGKRFIEAATVERSDPHGRILASVQSGILLIAVGFALEISRNVVDGNANGVLRLFGTLGMVVGAGFLVSGATVFVLSRRWGLLGGDRSPTGATEPTE